MFTDMKKILIALLAAVSVMAVSAADACAQGRFGIIGGMNFMQAERQSLNRSTMNKYHVGVKLGDVLPGFSSTNTCDLTVGYLELPVSIQWGPDLLLFRPFLDVTPYIGFGLNNKADAYIEGALPSMTNKNDWSDINRWEYGLGVGIGIEIWKFQVIGRYNWNFGSLYSRETAPEEFSMENMMRQAFSRGNNLGGFTLSLSLLF